jgi:hypothetical protein
MTVDRLSDAVAAEDEEAARQSKLSIDATGVLSWTDTVLAGIPRVEGFIVKAALADPDPHVQVVAFRPWERGFRPLAAFEQRQVADGKIASFRFNPGPGRKAALLRALELVRQQPWAKRAVDRHLALTVTNGSRGLDFAAMKLLIRAYRLYRRAIGRLGRRPHPPQPSRDFERSIVLICQNILVGEDRSAVSGDVGRIAFICHDLIPTVRPDLVADSKTDRDFGKNLELLVRAGATALCVSDAASATTPASRSSSTARP